METKDSKMNDFHIKQVRAEYEQALMLGTNVKWLTGINILASCAYKSLDYPNEEAFELGIKLLILASKEGEKYAFSEGARMFTSENNYGKGLDTDKILQIYQAGLEVGDKFSHYKLGEIYRCGLYSVKQDLDKALTYYADGARLESEECQFKLAEIYWLGHKVFNVEKDIVYAKQLLVQSSEHGYVDSKAYLALLYFEEIGDMQCGYKLLLEAIEEGSIVAYVIMGNLLEEGTVVEKDYEKAVEYYKLAAQHDNYFGKEACEEKKIDYRVRFTSQPRTISYSEPQNCDELEVSAFRFWWKSIVENGITYGLFTSADSGSVFEACYSRILEVIEKKYGLKYENKILEFTTIENIFYSIGKLVYEIENGGLMQYFSNSDFIRTSGLLRALNDVGAAESFKVIAACQKFAEKADEEYYMRKEKKLKENLMYYVLDYMLENYPKDLVL